eukprot:TRINITY_DN4446_c0_g1_i1.p1 TRINITY_DN4446_c0_g1~~TRINITY_DN4446_c0_g1_i1.p1  ORF type:complete len:355 (-),score=54.63 TRINITY_DN4446_c0_g1_i1:71-1135(-)
MGCFSSRVPMQTLNIALAGIARSGKTTLSKQLRVIHLEEPFSERELENFKDILKYNVFSGITSLIKQITDTKESLKQIDEKTNRKFVDHFMKISWEEFQKQLPELAPDILKFWEDKGVRLYVAENSIEDIERESQLSYVMTRITDIARPEYIPTVADAVRARQRTTGFTVLEFNTLYTNPKMHWKLYDMGGQMTERKKWEGIINDNTKAIIFCVALDEFDRISDENPEETFLDEAVNVFKHIASKVAQSDEPITLFLFLNKTDLFRNKLAKFKRFFADQYEGGKDYDNAIAFVTKKFSQDASVNFKCYETCALNKSQMSTVFEDVLGNIIATRLNKSGLIMEKKKDTDSIDLGL